MILYPNKSFMFYFCFCLCISFTWTNPRAQAKNKTSQAQAIKLWISAKGITGRVGLAINKTTIIYITNNGRMQLKIARIPNTTSLNISIESQPSQTECNISPSSAIPLDFEKTINLSCTTKKNIFKPILPISHAININPLLGQAVLLIDAPLKTPPTGIFKLEYHNGKTWVDTGLNAKATYNATNKEWRFKLDTRIFPAKQRLRITITPTGGTDFDGNILPTIPISWSFTTTANPLTKASDRKPNSGCPIDSLDSKAKPATANDPCNSP
ncbi:MAG: hypothetical protein JW841_07285 [Deltaproteobacteria bacterium]|nr:hypothetical protein [Deltaproteobacteria bacterium]